MDQWIFTPEELYQFPSITYGGMSLEEEWLRRLTGCILIQAIGARLEVPLPTLATAMTFFHRFFTQHSFVHYRLEVVAACCLYFACKVEESFRNINDVVGSTMLNILGPNNHSEDHAKLFHSLREGILQYEMILVETLCFDIALNHPYTPLIDMLAQTEADESVAHSALAFLNDSMRLPLCLLYDPKLIAAACICLAYRDQLIPQT
ncbi:cyclin-like protein [Dichotomocladium elegans]|nr:cyclin-like protein [Dichotomocladium elegans]